MRFKSLLLGLALSAASLPALGACPTTLPPSINFTGASVTEAQFKTAITQFRDYANCLLGASGVTTDAKTQLGLAAVATSGNYADLVGIPAAASPIPIGTILPYAGTTPPTGYVFAAGQQLSRTTFAGLFSQIGTFYGAGDGFSTFNVPDLRGRVPAGVDAMNGIAASRLGFGATGGIVSPASLGVAAGEQWHIQTQAELVQHSHAAFSTSTPSLGVSGGGVITDATTRDGLGAEQLAVSTQGNNATAYLPGSVGGSVTGSISTSTAIGATGSSSPMNLTQPTLVINYIVKF
jgi:microcystin-dependent protein